MKVATDKTSSLEEMCFIRSSISSACPYRGSLSMIPSVHIWRSLLLCSLMVSDGREHPRYKQTSHRLFADL